LPIESPPPIESPHQVAFASPSPASSYSLVAKRVLAPAIAPPAVGLCSAQVQQYQDGNAGPLFCRGGELIVEAWSYFAPLDPHVMSLGASSAFNDVQAAICADHNLSHATGPMEISGYVLAAAYYGWHFPTDPWQAMYNPPYCG
jgi:hypothetical protein